MNERIVDFIIHQRVATVCCVDEENIPYCFSCFYAFDVGKTIVLFQKQINAHHSQILLTNSVVAGTIQQDKLNPLAIKGIQFTGQILDSKNELCSACRFDLSQKFPVCISYAWRNVDSSTGNDKND